ncbi:alpha/beta hydrolase family protein [Caulobacter mirabilis]|uniref:Peptidase S9 n=1 Tax=Caulobacter mirabilis TaxID=69666 RepID=A0A2D2B344_9CAUL|nr:S9 family peptidase [Caulobacter mirabilis]ATQ44658.1 peptidase S9 [Caulobacter mirabilis]
MAGAVAVPLLAGGRAFAAAKPPSLYEILREPGLLDAALSPSGKQIAILGRTPTEGGWFKSSIVMLNADDLAQPGRRLDLGDSMDIEAVAWANEQRLLVWLKREFKMSVSGPGTQTQNETIVARQILAIGADGTKAVVLLDNKRRQFRGGLDFASVVDFMPNDPNHIVMQVGDYERGVWTLQKVNVDTGAATLLERGEDSTRWWTSFNGVPVARYGVNPRGTVVTLAIRAPGETVWTPYRQMRIGDHGRLEFGLVAATEDSNVVLVVASDGQEDGAKAVQSFDLRTRQITGVVRKARHTVETTVNDASDRLFAAAYLDDRQGYDFVDPAMAAPYRAIDGAFGKANNVAIVGMDKAANRLLLFVSGPKEPGAYVFYDRTSKVLENLGASRDWLTPERLAPMEALSITARDGQALRAYLTAPIVGTGPRPLVVLPHGGPEIRDRLGWDDWVQALAAKGWMVLQPNFRGSAGYGRTFTEAGWRQWGGRMQEDVEDCVDHLVKSGRVDPGRIAIMGASYGGYAALAGGMRKPEQYKAVVSIAGVSDLPELLATEREEGLQSPSYLYWKKSIGDPDADRAMLEAASPRRQAAAYAAPVLLVHGKKDTIVLYEQSKRMRDALRKAGKTVEYLEIEDMGHRDWTPQQSMDVLTKVIGFLEPRLGA